MNKIIISLLLCISISTSISAQQRSASQILEIANGHFRSKSQPGTRSLSTTVTPASRLLSPATRSANTGEPFYVVTSAEGLVIVSGDERMKKILGYSDTRNASPDRLPSSMQLLFAVYSREYNYLRQHPEVKSSQNTVQPRSSYASSVAPLLQTSWGQGAPYNALCPLYKGQPVPTGCVATAMAQIMKYYEYPAQGKGNIYYEKDATYVSPVALDLSKEPLEWNKMNGMGTEAEKNHAIAWLMACCGASVSMSYATMASEASNASVSTALVDNFGYDPNMQNYNRDNFKLADWMGIIKKELSEKRPVLCGAHSATTLGHSFVLDGYNSEDMIHVNWGFNGDTDGYYEMSSMNPGQAGPGSSIGGYNLGMSILTGIRKPSDTSRYKSNFITIESGIELTASSIGRDGTVSIKGLIFTNQSGTFNGILQPVLLQNDKFIPLGQAKRVDNVLYRKGVNTEFNNLTFPASSVPNGTYRLYLASKDDRETEWQIVVMDQKKTPYYDVTVSATSVEFSNPTNLKGLKVSSITLPHKLYNQSSARFFVDIVNSGSEWTGRSGIILQPATQDSFDGLLPITQDRTVFLAGNNTIEFLAETLKLAAGEYKIRPCYSFDGIQWNPIDTDKIQTITVYPKATHGSYTLQVSSAHIERMTLTEKDTFKITVTIRNTGQGPFDDSVGIRLSTNLDIKERVFIDPGDTFTHTFTASQLPDGEHTVTIFCADYLTGNKTLSGPYEFSVRSLSGGF